MVYNSDIRHITIRLYCNELNILLHQTIYWTYWPVRTVKQYFVIQSLKRFLKRLHSVLIMLVFKLFSVIERQCVLHISYWFYLPFYFIHFVMFICVSVVCFQATEMCTCDVTQAPVYILRHHGSVMDYVL